jgi:hypothetical protein
MPSILRPLLILPSVLLFAALAAPPAFSGAVKFAGVRAEIDNVDPAGWHNAVKSMADLWPGAQQMIFMTASTVVKGGSKMEFPADGKSKPKVSFGTADALEKYLAHFDDVGIKAYLILRPGLADVADLIGLTMDRYKQHKSLAGIDVSIMYIDQPDPNKYWEGRKVTDAEGEAWEKKVKSYGEDKNLVLMHWDEAVMPPAYKGSIIFGDESSEATIAELTAEYKNTWAPRLAPNLSFFFIGAEEDRTAHGNWSKLKNPPKEFGEAVAAAVPTDMGIFWIDVKGVLPTAPLAIRRDPARPGERASAPLGDRALVPSVDLAGRAESPGRSTVTLPFPLAR